MGAQQVLAEIALEQAEFVRSETSLNEVKTCLDERRQSASFKAGRMENGFGSLYTQMGRLDEAAASLKIASDIWSKYLPDSHQWMGALHNNLGAWQRSKGNIEEAWMEYDKSAAIWRVALGESHPIMATYYNNIAELGMLSKHMEAVKSALNTALGLRREAFGDDHPWTALVVSNMGEYLMLVGQVADALGLSEFLCSRRRGTFPLG